MTLVTVQGYKTYDYTYLYCAQYGMCHTRKWCVQYSYSSINQLCMDFIINIRWCSEVIDLHLHFAYLKYQFLFIMAYWCQNDIWFIISLFSHGGRKEA